MKHILSFDIAKGKSIYCFIDELRNTIIDASLIEHNKSEFDNLFKLVKNYPNLIVIMESTSIYHLPVENYFRSKGIDTIVINPKLVKQFKDTLNKSKTDKLDCFKIARCYLGTIDNFYYKNDEYFIYNPLARQYWSLVEGQTRLKNRYKQLIEIVFPEFNLIFNDLYDDLALNFIHDFPHPVLFVNRRIDYLMNYYHQPKPKVCILCEREAFFAEENPDVRLTFDENLRYRYGFPDAENIQEGIPITDADKRILEIKTPGAMPLWLVDALSECKIYPRSFSKYGHAYYDIIKGDN